MKYFRILFKNIDWILLLLPLVFMTISVIMIGSTSYDGAFHFTRNVITQIIAFGIGYALLFTMLFFDYQLFARFEKYLYAFAVVLLLTVYIPGLGSTQYGSRGWLSLGPVSFQPAEIAKMIFILLFASYLSRNRDNLYNFKGLVMAGLYAFPIIFIIAILQNDLGNALVICFAAFIMIFLAGVDGKLYAKICGGLLACIPLSYFVLKDHQKERITAFLHPNDLSLEGNWQVWNSKVAIGSGGLSGKGLFQGTQKELDFLPVQDSDFIFSVISEELGFVGGAAVILLYALFLYRFIRISLNTKEMYGMLIAAGFLSMFFFQIFENIGMSMGLMPVTGITLPFISSGGSSVMANFIALGLVLNVQIRSKRINF